MTNRLYYGDNLDVLRDHVATESVDLFYLDPPFNSNANYNILFKSPTGSSSDAQIEAFEDTWHWNDKAEYAFDRRRPARTTRACISSRSPNCSPARSRTFVCGRERGVQNGRTGG